MIKYKLIKDTLTNRCDEVNRTLVLQFYHKFLTTEVPGEAAADLFRKGMFCNYI